MEKLIEQTANIVREAARSPLGLLALLVIAVSLVSLLFFQSSSDVIKVPIFLALLIAAAFFGIKVFQLASEKEPDSINTTSVSDPSEDGNKNAVLERRSTKPNIFVGWPSDKFGTEADAIVIEQDRDLLLETDSSLFESTDSLKAILDEAKAVKGREAGTVLVRGRSAPYYFLAIVHDFSVEPSWSEQWVSMAFDAALKEGAARKVRSIGMPLLGTVHGRLGNHRSAELLRESLEKADLGSIESLRLFVGSDTDSQLLQFFQDAGYSVSSKATTTGGKF